MQLGTITLPSRIWTICSVAWRFSRLKPSVFGRISNEPFIFETAWRGLGQGQGQGQGLGRPRSAARRAVLVPRPVLAPAATAQI